jgi:hypothetical protein
MSAPPRTANSWFAPSSMLAAFGMLMAAYGSYVSFQRDASNQIGRLEERVNALRERVDRLERAR